MEKITFINTWGYPDIHITRNFIKGIVKEKKDTNFNHFCFKDKDLIKDVCDCTVELNSDPLQGFRQVTKENGYIVTHHQELNDLSPNSETKNRFDKTYELFQHIYKDFDLDLNDDKQHYLPTIDYSQFYNSLLFKVDDLAEDNEDYIIIDNSINEQNILQEPELNSIIYSIAKDNPKKKIFITNSFDNEIDNIYDLKNVFPYNCNINEVSWFSKYCGTIIGETKDYFSSCLVKDNIKNKNKRFINIIESEDDILIPAEYFKSEYITIDKKDKDSIIEKI